MYFMPRTNRWYRWAVHTKARYRYSILFLFWGTLFFGWWYGISPWLDRIIQQELALGEQLERQTIELARMERKHADLEDDLPVLRKEMTDYAPVNALLWQQQQLTTLLDTAQHVGMTIHSYTDEKGKQKSWGSYRTVQLTMNGTLDMLSSFLTFIKQSRYMMQCTQLRATRTNADLFMVVCSLKMMMVKG